MGEKLSHGTPSSAQGPTPQPLAALGLLAAGIPCPVPSRAPPSPVAPSPASSCPWKGRGGELAPRGSRESEGLHWGHFLAGGGEGDSATGTAGMSSHALPSAASSTLLFPIIYYLTTVLVCFSPGCEPGGLVLGPPPPGALPRTVEVLPPRQCLPLRQCPLTKGGGPQPWHTSSVPAARPTLPLRPTFAGRGKVTSPLKIAGTAANGD